MPYGQGQMLGAGVDPRMFVQDYSGFTRAAEIQAQGMQNLGTAIGNVAGQVGDYFKQQGEKKKLVKQSGLQIDAALQLFPDLAPSLQSAKERMRDENIPLADRAAEAEVVANLINMGIGEMRDRANRSFEQEKFAADQAYRQAGLGMQAAELGIRQQASQQAAESAAAKRSLKKIVVSTPLGEAELDVSVDSQGNPYDIQSGKRIGDLKNYATGEGTWEALEQNMPPTSQVGGISDSIAQTAKMNIGRLSTAKTPGTQGGNLGCADAICRTYEQATGEELVKGGTLSTSEMVGKLANDPRFQSVSVNQAQPGDIIVTPRGKKAGHTGIVLEGGAIASNSSKGFKGGSPGTFVQNYTINSWMNSVAPRNPGKTQVFRRIEEAASPQMAGTPEQKAEVARQIEQGAGMAIAQAGGGMPTEPSMAAQQPQLPQQAQPASQPRLARGRLLSGGGDEYRPSTAEEEKFYGTKGQVSKKTGKFSPITPPPGMVIRQSPGGGIEFIQGAGAADRFTKAAEEAKKQAVQSADRNIQDLMEAKRLYASVIQSKGILPAAARKLESITPGTQLHTIQKDIIEPFKNRLGLEQLTQLRQASPTGAAVGNPTNAEGQRLESVFGSLDPTASPTIFNRNLNRAIESYLDVIHGTPEQRDKLIEEGKITEQQNAQIEALYPSSTMNTMGIEQPRLTGGTGNPAIDEIIQRNNIQIK